MIFLPMHNNSNRKDMQHFWEVTMIELRTTLFGWTAHIKCFVQCVYTCVCVEIMFLASLYCFLYCALAFICSSEPLFFNMSYYCTMLHCATTTNCVVSLRFCFLLSFFSFQLLSHPHFGFTAPLFASIFLFLDLRCV